LSPPIYAKRDGESNPKKKNCSTEQIKRLGGEGLRPRGESEKKRF